MPRPRRYRRRPDRPPRGCWWWLWRGAVAVVVVWFLISLLSVLAVAVVGGALS